MQSQFSIPTIGVEVWRPVLGYEDLYAVSDLGRVRRIARSAGTRGAILSPFPNSLGYLRVGLCRRNKRQKLSVHRLVIEAFLGPFSPGEEANHKNGMKPDNRLANLEKVTHRKNMLHAIRSGLMNVQGEDNPQAKLSEDDVRAIRRLAGIETRVNLARRFGVSVTAITLIIGGQRWRHG